MNTMGAATGLGRLHQEPEQPAKDGVLRWWWLALLLSLLVVAAMPRAIGLAGGDYPIHRTFHDLDGLRAALKSYHEVHGAYPTSAQGLGLLRSEGIVNHLPVDPWRHPYVYRYNTTTDTFLLYSQGADGEDDMGAGDDITDPDKAYSCREYGVGCPSVAIPITALALSAASLVVGLARGLAALGRPRATG
jgi:type II secretion system (T2SS) protein G